MLKRKRYCSRDSSDDINLNLTKKKKHDSLSLIKNSSSIYQIMHNINTKTKSKFNGYDKKTKFVKVIWNDYLGKKRNYSKHSKFTVYIKPSNIKKNKNDSVINNQLTKEKELTKELTNIK